MKHCKALCAFFFSMAVLLACFGAGAAEKPEKRDDAREDGRNFLEQPGRLFDLRIPEGFESVQMDEPGIMKWKKDSGEIYLVVGDIFVDSSDGLFRDLRKALDASDKIEEVKNIRVDGGKAMLYKEKPVDDPSRRQMWRLIVLTKKKMINVDFIAPVQDFKTYAPAFEDAVKSFKLRSSS